MKSRKHVEMSFNMVKGQWRALPASKSGESSPYQ